MTNCWLHGHTFIESSYHGIEANICSICGTLKTDKYIKSVIKRIEELSNDLESESNWAQFYFEKCMELEKKNVELEKKIEQMEEARIKLTIY
jgi:adenosylmethionine-8-amino-7-oxononanoate aminotransferase